MLFFASTRHTAMLTHCYEDIAAKLGADAFDRRPSSNEGGVGSLGGGLRLGGHLSMIPKQRLVDGMRGNADTRFLVRTEPELRPLLQNVSELGAAIMSAETDDPRGITVDEWLGVCLGFLGRRKAQRAASANRSRRAMREMYGNDRGSMDGDAVLNTPPVVYDVTFTAPHALGLQLGQVKTGVVIVKIGHDPAAGLVGPGGGGGGGGSGGGAEGGNLDGLRNITEEEEDEEEEEGEEKAESMVVGDHVIKLNGKDIRVRV